VNALLAAALIPDRTTIRFASSNYQVQETCFFLERLGVSIDGVGTATLVVRGISDACADVEHANSEDPIDAMMLVALAATTTSSLEVRRAPIDFLRLELCRLKDMGLDFDVSAPYRAENGRTELADLQVRPSELVAPTLKLHPMPYPGLNVDNLPFFFPIAAQASGETSFNDWMFENRLVSLMDLAKLGAEIELVDAHRARVRGRRPFAPRQLVAPDALRPAACVMIGMLAAKGTSILRDVYQIRRGYERIDERLRSIGADVQVISPA
jgi:UDP-N-acetylglucosamine 1-carboxyvinyltransferase